MLNPHGLKNLMSQYLQCEQALIYSPSNFHRNFSLCWMMVYISGKDCEYGKTLLIFMSNDSFY